MYRNSHEEASCYFWHQWSGTYGVEKWRETSDVGHDFQLCKWPSGNGAGLKKVELSEDGCQGGLKWGVREHELCGQKILRPSKPN